VGFECTGRLLLSGISGVQKEVVISGVELGVSICVKHASLIILILQMN